MRANENNKSRIVPGIKGKALIVKMEYGIASSSRGSLLIVRPLSTSESNSPASFFWHLYLSQIIQVELVARSLMVELVALRPVAPRAAAQPLSGWLNS